MIRCILQVRWTAKKTYRSAQSNSGAAAAAAAAGGGGGGGGGVVDVANDVANDAILLTDPLIVWNCFAFEYFHIALICWTFC